MFLYSIHDDTEICILMQEEEKRDYKIADVLSIRPYTIEPFTSAH